MPKHVLMSDYEIITDGRRRRCWTAAEKLRNVEETLEDGASTSVVARRNGVVPNLLDRWRRLLLDGGAVAVSEDEDVTNNRAVRQGSREWVRYQRDTSQPKTAHKPPRKRWYEYPKRRPPQAIARAWSEPILGVVDRTGRATFQHMQNTLQPTIEATLVPRVAPDAMVLFDGAPQYEAIARAQGFSFKVLVGGRRTKRMPKVHHLNSVNSLHSKWKRLA